MKLEIKPYIIYTILIGFLILIALCIRGCHQSKLEVAAKEKALQLADSTLAVLRIYKVISDSTAKDFQDSLEFERGQKELALAQKERTEEQLDKSSIEVKQLIDKYKYAKYADTAAVTVPSEFVDNCHDCFVKLEDQNNLVNKYRSDVHTLQVNTDKQLGLYQNRISELKGESLSFYNKFTALAKLQKQYDDKLQPHGRLYLSWGVLFKPWPTYAGAGLMYQNKRNLIYSGMVYYGTGGYMVQTTINFPLSIKF